MKELAKQFIGEECVVYISPSSSSSCIRGVIKEVSDGGILIENAPAGGRELVNLDYVVHIYRRLDKKKGKNKSAAV